MKEYQRFYYNDDLARKIMYSVRSQKEIDKKKELDDLIMGYSSKVFNSYDDELLEYYEKTGYLDELGYFISSEADRGWYNLYMYGHETTPAFREILLEHLLHQGSHFEFHNRKSLEQDYSSRFGIDGKDYHGPFHFAEYALTKLNIYYDGLIPEPDIDYYIEYLERVAKKSYSYDQDVKKLTLKKQG